MNELLQAGDVRWYRINSRAFNQPVKMTIDRTVYVPSVNDTDEGSAFVVGLNDRNGIAVVPVEMVFKTLAGCESGLRD